MNNKKLLSIIIPVYNREKMITKALDSIPNLNSIEVIVVDDCSTDNTYKILKEYKKIDLLIFKTKSNLGPGAARNIGIDEATGDYITFLDSDD
jgi:glycosyltransferase involved in cell wall biosynthesis